MQQTK